MGRLRAYVAYIAYVDLANPYKPGKKFRHGLDTLAYVVCAMSHIGGLIRPT